MHKRNQAADERRRRMLLDESCSSMPAQSSSSSDEDREEAARAKRSYTSAARSGRQPRLVDLAPKRWPAFLAHFTAGGLAIAGIDWLARHAHTWSETLDPQLLALFDPAALGSLARWIAALWLLTAAALSVIIYTMRRHKADDYHGSYRTWMWAAGLLTLASFDASTSAHRLLTASLMHQFGTPLGGNGTAWWIGTWGLLLGLVGLRLAIDMRASRAALTTVGLAAFMYTTVAVSILWPPLLTHTGQSTVTASTLLLVGHLFLLTALAFNARFVFLDAQGLIAEREPRKSRSERRAEKEASAEKQARAERRKAKKAKAAEEADDTEDSSTDDDTPSKPRRFLFWTILPAEEREAARREKEDERELRREAKLEARREAREKKEAAKADKLSARDSKREEKTSSRDTKRENKLAARELKREEREKQLAERQSKKEAKAESTPKKTRQDNSEKSSPLSAKIRQSRDSDSSNSGPAANSEDEQHLSKAERKRLKKERRREMRDAA